MTIYVEAVTKKLIPGSNNKLFRSLVGKSLAMQNIQYEIKQAATSDANVLILGESGTGKEVAARNIHYFSNRKRKNFVPVNCGAIHPDLLESELFGHEKGAFTGAITSRSGCFSMAEGGTLFLDEIGEMTMAMQVKLLRVLENRVFERVGGSETIKADVRIIAATNRNLEEMVKQGKFSEDLYFSLDVCPIQLPALQQRIEDLPLLTKELILRLENTKQNTVRFTKNAIVAMSKYDWPGNVRELANLIERMSITYPHGVVGENDLPAKIKANALSENTGIELKDLDERSIQAVCSVPTTINVPVDASHINLPAEGFDLKNYIANIEIKIIEDALNNTNGVIAQAAKTLGLRRTTLAEKMRKHRIVRSPDHEGCNVY